MDFMKVSVNQRTRVSVIQTDVASQLSVRWPRVQLAFADAADAADAAGAAGAAGAAAQLIDSSKFVDEAGIVEGTKLVATVLPIAPAEDGATTWGPSA
jgi:hypothetical protein